jgi:hypothetical protein
VFNDIERAIEMTKQQQPFHLYLCSKSATRPLPFLRVDVAGMIDRPDSETVTTAAGCHHQGDGNGKNERPQRCILHLGCGVRRGKFHGWHY